MNDRAEIQVVIVDDHPALCRGLELVLPRLGLRVTGTAGSAEDGERMIRDRRPQVAVVDIGLADGSGTLLAERVAEGGSPTTTVLYTGYCEPAALAEAVSSGARGVVLKTSPIEDLAAAIEAAADGRDFLDHRVSDLLPDAGPPNRTITAREAEVLGLIAGGLTVEAAAATLFLSAATVQTHIANATRKLGARGRLHAVVLALTSGDLELDGLTHGDHTLVPS